MQVLVANPLLGTSLIMSIFCEQVQCMQLPETLFHGTSCRFDRPHVGGSDGVFWTAASSAVAQNYIPVCGSTIYTGVMDGLQLRERVWPKQYDVFTAVAALMGCTPREVTWDNFGRASTYTYPPNWPTYSEVQRYIEDSLGYKCEGNGSKGYEMKFDGWDSLTKQPLIKPANFFIPGELLVIEGHQALRIFDMRHGEGDLQDPQHRKIDAFERLRKSGWDGVVIKDFAQSKAWGNVEHDSFGFFAHAIEHLKIEKISAKNFDWGPNGGDLGVSMTPQYESWLNARRAQHFVVEAESALSRGAMACGSQV